MKKCHNVKNEMINFFQRLNIWTRLDLNVLLCLTIIIRYLATDAQVTVALKEIIGGLLVTFRNYRG